MSDCDEFRPLISALVDKELPLKEAALVERHIQTCEGCPLVFAEVGALKSATTEASGMPSIDMMARINEELFATSENSVAAEMRLLRNEMRALREEVSDLRRELAQRSQISRSLVLNLPDAPTQSRNQYRLV